MKLHTVNTYNVTLACHVYVFCAQFWKKMEIVRLLRAKLRTWKLAEWIIVLRRRSKMRAEKRTVEKMRKIPTSQRPRRKFTLWPAFSWPVPWSPPSSCRPSWIHFRGTEMHSTRDKSETKAINRFATTRQGEEDDDEKKKNEGEVDDEISGLKLLVATIRQWKVPRQILIIPITIWSGLEQGFFGADFTAVTTT